MAVSRGLIHRDLDRAIKRFMLTYQVPLDIAGLPPKQKRDELEELSWTGVQEAIKSKSSGGCGVTPPPHARLRIPDQDRVRDPA